MKEFVLIFLTTISILTIGIFFGYEQIANSYEISEATRSLAEPFSSEIDKSFLESLIPAL